MTSTRYITQNTRARLTTAVRSLVAPQSQAGESLAKLGSQQLKALHEEIAHSRERLAGFGGVPHLAFQHHVQRQFARQRLGEIKSVDADDLLRSAEVGEIWTAWVAIDPVSTTSPTAPPRSGILSSSRIENASLPSMKAVMSVSCSRSSRA